MFTVLCLYFRVPFAVYFNAANAIPKASFTMHKQIAGHKKNTIKKFELTVMISSNRKSSFRMQGSLVCLPCLGLDHIALVKYSN